MGRLITVVFLLVVTLMGQEPATPAAPSTYVVVLRRGRNWLPGKTVREQPLREHGQYLQSLMEAGKLVFAGPFLDDQGGLILLKASSEAEAKKMAEEDPAVRGQIMVPDVHPFRMAFDSSTGLSPFKRPGQ